MKILAIVFVLFFCVSSASAGTLSLVNDRKLCREAPPLTAAALLQAHRLGNKVLLDVTAELNCAYVPDKHELRQWREAVTVSETTKSPTGATAMCICQHKLRFEIVGLSEAAKDIYYLQDGTVLGNVAVP